MKTRLFLAILASAMIVFGGGCKKDKFVEVVGTCPLVVFTSPSNGETAVPLNKVITATFNESMKPSTITQASFTVAGGSMLSGTVTYTDVTASFTPASPLLPNTTYVGKITTAVKDLKGNALQTEYVWSFSTGAIVAPMVISTDPTNAATGVVLNKVVEASFNMPMDPLTINATTFTLKLGTTAVAGNVTYLDSTASFTANSALIADTTYTATITTGAKNPAGVPIAADHIWTFRTGTLLAPTVVSTLPINNATGVPQNQVVSATFSEPMASGTLNSSTFILRQGANQIAGTVTYSGSTASFTPTTNLMPGTVYTATITTGAQNQASVGLANNYVWTFTTVVIAGPTVISTDPIDNATGVPLNQVVRAIFSEPMDPLTIGALSFTLKQGLATVPGTVTYSGSTASYTPSSSLSSGLVYTATITTTARSLANNIPLASDYVWDFTATAVAAPIVVSTDPVDFENNVPTNQVISATFNMPMDPVTITAATFTLRMGLTLVPGVVNYSAGTATFTPNFPLVLDTTYSATITNGVRSATNVNMVNNYVWTFNTNTIPVPPAVDLGTALQFGILAGVGISNNAGFSEIHDLDVGISPGVRSSVSGFPPAIVVNGAIYCSDDPTPPGVAAMLIQAKQDLTDAYLQAEGATNPAPALVSGDIGGLTLAPGIYKSNSTLMIQSGDLTLDAQGNPNASWIFQVASGFTTVGGAGGSIILSGGAQAKNVFWQTGSSATIGDFTTFQGNILALTSITMNSDAVAYGRMLARNGSVVMTSTNFIYRP